MSICLVADFFFECTPWAIDVPITRLPDFSGLLVVVLFGPHLAYLSSALRIGMETSLRYAIHMIMAAQLCSIKRTGTEVQR